jgi:hypothetical protein
LVQTFKSSFGLHDMLLFSILVLTLWLKSECSLSNMRQSFYFCYLNEWISFKWIGQTCQLKILCQKTRKKNRYKEVSCYKISDDVIVTKKKLLQLISSIKLLILWAVITYKIVNDVLVTMFSFVTSSWPQILSSNFITVFVLLM